MATPSGVRLSVAVQAHSLRATIAETLASTIGGDTEVCFDPDPDARLRSPWRTYRHALQTTPGWATHRLIVQDDAEVCHHFGDVLDPMVASQPDRLLCLFVGGYPRDHTLSIMQGCDRGDSWVILNNTRWCPCVALVWPRPMIDHFLAYCEQKRGWDDDRFRSDDERIGSFLNNTGQRPLASVPSLVEHPDMEPSLIGDRTRQGTDPGRVAACFIHPQCDVRTIDWSLGPN